MRFVLNFPPPLLEQIGYGRGLHDAAWEVHQRIQAGEKISPAEVESVATRHFHLPFAGEDMKSCLGGAAINALQGYTQRCIAKQQTTIAAEQEVRLELGTITVIGRIDLVTEGADGVTLAELKTAHDSGRDPDQMVPRTYALALEATTGVLPDRVETRTISANENNDRSTKMTPDVVEETRSRIAEAGLGLSERRFPPLPMAGTDTCQNCDIRLICGHNSDKRSNKGGI